MIKSLGVMLKLLPWILLTALISWMLFQEKLSNIWTEGEKETYQSTILNRVEQIGKLELVKYNFQEVTEIKKIADYVDLKLFKYKPLPDAKAVLISQGSATGCIDLTQLKASDLSEKSDTLYVSLPQPEICNFKIDLEKSRLYELQISYLPTTDQKEFIEQLYEVAEAEIREAALKSGILDQTMGNAELMLKPLLENISGKVVIITYQLDQSILKNDL
ncbi:MAG: DUF4230 domain-containing protein [Cyclobacteriaceae bacterium]